MNSMRRPLWVIICFSLITICPKLLGQGAAHYLEQATIYYENGQYERAASSYIDLGNWYFGQKQTDSASKYYEKGLAALPPKKHTLLEGLTANTTGIIYLRKGYYNDALKMFQRAIIAYEKIGKPGALADLYLQAGSCTDALHQDDATKSYLNKAIEYAKVSNKHIVLTDSYNLLAQLAEKEGDTQQLIAYNKLLYSSKQDESNTVYEQQLEAKEKDIENLERKSDETQKQYKDRIKRLKQSRSQIYQLKKDLEDERERLTKQINALSELRGIQESLITEQFSQIEEQEEVLHAKEDSLFYQQVVLGLAIVALIAIGTLSLFIYRGSIARMKANELLEEQKIAIEEQRNKVQLAANQTAKVYEKLQSSLNYAQRLQLAMLPTIEIIKHKLPKSFVLFKPKEVVSGDFYWYAAKGSKVFIAAVDCTGHGVPGAFMSMLGYEMLNEIVINRGVSKPSAILQFLDMGIKKSLHKGQDLRSRDGMDMALCCIDFKENEIQYAGAKNPLVYVQNNHMSVIKGDKFSIGNQVGDQRYTNHTIPLSKDPITCYLYSDGFQDQFGGKHGRKFLSKKFKELLHEVYHQPIEQQEELLRNTFSQWKEGVTQVDDVLIVGFQVGKDL